MKVGELIEILKQHDPERKVWMIYDGTLVFPFNPRVVTEEDEKYGLRGDEHPAVGDLIDFAG